MVYLLAIYRILRIVTALFLAAGVFMEIMHRIFGEWQHCGLSRVADSALVMTYWKQSFDKKLGIFYCFCRGEYS